MPSPPIHMSKARVATARRDLLLTSVQEYLALPLDKRTVALRDALLVMLCDWARAEQERRP